jgi:hypothetical protein
MGIVRPERLDEHIRKGVSAREAPGKRIADAGPSILEVV